MKSQMQKVRYESNLNPVKPTPKMESQSRKKCTKRADTKGKYAWVVDLEYVNLSWCTRNISPNIVLYLKEELEKEL